ncbi:MAG: glycosyltransferase family 2 protein [Aquificae bacterium]|nr:glycosyltransferase family 2 protein [Aquificota bacterium]
MENKKLGICIPTYNRANLLDSCLERIVPQVKKYNIPIFISDNASTDNTQEVVKKYQKEYEYIHYHRNDVNIGLDPNFEKVLKLADTEYRWLLGDDDSFFEGSLDVLLELLENDDFDLIVVNAARVKDKKNPKKGISELRVKDVKSKTFTDKNQLLEDLGWHMTLLSSLIFSKNLIEKADFDRYRNTNFLQVGIAFEYLGRKKDIKVYFEESPIVYTFNELGPIGASWFPKIMKIFVEDWFNVISSLPPSYSLKSKLTCVKNHDKKTGVFSLLRLLNIRSFGYLNKEIYNKYKDFYPFVINLPSWMIFLISIFPRNIAEDLRNSYLKLKGINA